MRRKAIKIQMSHRPASNLTAEDVRATFVSDGIPFSAGSIDGERPPSQLQPSVEEVAYCKQNLQSSVMQRLTRPQTVTALVLRRTLSLLPGH